MKPTEQEINDLKARMFMKRYETMMDIAQLRAFLHFAEREPLSAEDSERAMKIAKKYNIEGGKIPKRMAVRMLQKLREVR